MKIVKIFSIAFVFIFLTALTQIGGLIYIISLTSYLIINKKFTGSISRITIKTFSFLILYIVLSLTIVPVIAKSFGRIPLPLSGDLRPLNFMTYFLNRNYVKAELSQAVNAAAIEMKNKFPGTRISYLDGCFPFFDKFPLIPHLSHNDGEKLDLSFYYLDYHTGARTNEAPSFIGYGICEEAKSGENNMPQVCSDKGYWQYSFLKSVVPQGNKPNFTFDEERTKYLLNILADNIVIGKIFIEPHLKTRLKLTSYKIRFHGCQAVRHDDHIHIQLK